LFNRLYDFGCRISDRGAHLAGHPTAILAVALFCVAWFALGGEASANLLSVVLAIAAITLTQMVLNQQRRSEAAMHLKIDELVRALEGARDELAGIEHKSEAEIEALRQVEH
jgi:low affinity Fe/Cu permease